MLVKQIMTTQVNSCRPEDTLARAAQLMWDHDCGCLPVCVADGANRVTGMITDRDICMSALFQGRALQELTVAGAMSSRLHACRASDPLADVERTMREARVRRLPVIDDEGSLVGMVTLADLAREAERGGSRGSRGISGEEIGVTLASICQPPHRELAA